MALFMIVYDNKRGIKPEDQHSFESDSLRVAVNTVSPALISPGKSSLR